MDETEPDEVRILGANEAASSRPPERSHRPASAPAARAVPTPSWEDEEEGWDTEWLATDGDLDLDDDPFAAAGSPHGDADGPCLGR